MLDNGLLFGRERAQVGFLEDVLDVLLARKETGQEFPEKSGAFKERFRNPRSRFRRSLRVRHELSPIRIDSRSRKTRNELADRAFNLLFGRRPRAGRVRGTHGTGRPRALLPVQSYTPLPDAAPATRPGASSGFRGLGPPRKLPPCAILSTRCAPCR